MTAPSHGTRSTPEGTPLTNGHQVTITFASDPNVSLKEVTVQPPGLDRGEPIETTCQHNGSDRTFAARKLLTTTPLSSSCKYDPAYLSSIRTLMLLESDTVTIEFPDGVKWSSYGVLRSFTPQEMSEGSLPLADIVVDFLSVDSSGNEEPMIGTGT